MIQTNGRYWGRCAILLLAAGLSLAIFFRFQIANGFTLFFGDRYDAVIETSILQHWANVLHGKEVWNVTAYFYPARDTLGYNDGYFAYGLIFTLVRSLGVPLIAAVDSVHAIMKALGFFGMYLLLRTLGSCRFGWSVFGAILFTVSDLTLQHGGHGQLFTLAFAPYAFFFAWRAYGALLVQDGRRFFLFGAAFLVDFGLWISTAFYLAWFLALIGLVLIIVLLLRAGAGREAIFRAIAGQWRGLIGLAIIGTIVLAPFVAVYLPKSVETGMHPYDEVRDTILAPLELINTVPSNVLWGRSLDIARRTISPALHINRDQIFGIPPLLFGLAAFAAIAGIRRSRSFPLAALAWTTLIAWLLMVRLFDFSLWPLVYATVPAAAGIRVVGRFNLLLLVPVILFAVGLLDRCRHRWLAGAAAALLLAEEISVTAPVQLDQAEQMAMLAHIPPPPATCKSFYVVTARDTPYPRFDPGNDHIYAHNVDAMLLSEVIGLPTVNGYSTFLPPHWDFDRRDAPDYDARAKRYAGVAGIDPPCRLNRMSAEAWRLVRD